MANRFLSNIELDAGLVDVNGNTGTSGQILSSTGSGVAWDNALGSYLPLAGGTMTGNIVLDDSVELRVGTDSDLRIYHNGTNNFILNAVGNLNIRNTADDGNITFQSDDGLGGYDNYFIIDGGATQTQVYRDFRFQDTIKAKFGSSSDLEIFHDGIDSYISEVGTGDLLITSNGASVQINKGTTENMAEFITDGAVKLYYDSAIKFETTSTGATITGDLTVNGGDITLGGTGRIQGVDTVSANTDAANKLYVDNAVAGVPVGDITAVNAGTGLDGGGTSGSVTLNIEYVGLGNAILAATDSSGSAIASGAKIWYSDDATIAHGSVSDLPFTNNTGDITSVTAGTNLTGGGTSGAVTLNMATGGVGAGTYGSTTDSTKIDTITVDAYGRVTAVATGNTGDLSAESSTTNYLSKFTGATTVGNTSFYESGDDLYIPNLIQHIGDTDTYFGFISDGTIQFVADSYAEMLIQGNVVRVYNDLRLDGGLSIFGDFGTSGQVLSSTGAAIDWVWTPQTINSTFSHDASTGVYVYMPFNTLTDTTSLQYYNTFVAPKTGRVRKIVLKNAGVGTAPSMSSTTLRVVKNGATAYTSSAQSSFPSINQWVSVTLGDSDATFVAGDKLNFGFNANGLWRGATATIIVEYTD